jgi:tetratricopeptide (TPR) repeat protein
MQKHRHLLWFAALLLSLAAAGALATVWWQGRPERYLREAERQLEAGSWELAAPWLDLPERTKAVRDRALILRARVALERGRPKDAVRPLQGVDVRGPWAAEAAFWKGRTLYAVGNTPLAIAWFQTALAARPTDVETLRWLAAAAYDLGDRRTCLESLKTLTAVKPDDARAWRTRALVTWTEPDAGELELSAARLAYEESLKLDPDQPLARLELADVLVRMGRYDEADRQLLHCQGQVPEADRADLRAQCAWFRGERDRCRAIVAVGLKQAPNHAGLLARQALLDAAVGRLAEAVAGFDRAVRVDPYNAQWFYMRAVALRALGRRAEAERDVDRSTALKEAQSTMANLCGVASQRPADPGVRIRLGRLCEVLGKPSLAAMWYRAALACDPRNEEARRALAAALPR